MYNGNNSTTLNNGEDGVNPVGNWVNTVKENAAAKEQARIDSGVIRTDSFANTQADLTRQQWEGFKTRYLPVQDELLTLANSDQLVTEQLDRNKFNVDNSFSLAKQGEDIRMGRYGLTPENSTQSKNNTGLLKSLTTASVNNETRGAAEDLQTKIITGQGGAPSTLADIGG